MRKIVPLIEKEVKDLLRDPRIYISLIIPVIMLPLLGSLMSTAMSTSIQTSTGGLKIAVIDADKTRLSKEFLNLLKNTGMSVDEMSEVDLNSAINQMRELGSEFLMVIEKGFEEDLSNFRKANIEVYAIVDSVGLGSIGKYSTLQTQLGRCIEIFSDMLIYKLRPNVNTETVRKPLNFTFHSILKNNVVNIDPQTLLGRFLMGYGMIVPLLLFILSISVVQIAATATAVENEEKTLETLLTLPVSRYEILVAKLLGSSIISVIGGVFFTIGFLIYFENMLKMPGMDILTGASQVLPPAPLESFLLLAISLILSIFFITSLGVVIGALSSDVRMANSLLGIIIIPIMIPFFLIFYGDPKVMPLAIRLIIYAFPTSYPMLISRDMIINPMPIEAVFGITYSIIITAVILYFTSLIMSPEKLLTLQYKLRARTMKKEKLAS
ncbi:MAG: ABC transporter permease [candidate division WOR-3 bacterium]